MFRVRGCFECSSRIPAASVFADAPTPVFENSTWAAASFCGRHPRYGVTAPPINKRKMKQVDIAMDDTLPADLRSQMDQELASGRYHSPDELTEQAVRRFLDERQRGQQRLDALRRIGQAVDQAGLYERVLIPGRR